MQYLVIGIDGTDDDALHRRLAVRADHIALGDKLMASGNMWYGAALLNESGKMKGSMLYMYFDTEDQLQEWLAKEPYVTGDVWRSIEIHKSNIRDPWQFNRPEEFYKGKQKTI